jgi:hypothetical protein
MNQDARKMIKRKDAAVRDRNIKAFPDDSLAFGKPIITADGDANNDNSAGSKTKKSKGNSQSVTLKDEVKDHFRAALLAAAENGHADLDDMTSTAVGCLMPTRPRVITRKQDGKTGRTK